MAAAVADSPTVRAALAPPTRRRSCSRTPSESGETRAPTSWWSWPPTAPATRTPTRHRIGEPFIGDIAPALAGATFTETYTGTLGESVRAVVPVHDGSGAVIGLVIGRASPPARSTAGCSGQLPVLLGVAGAGLSRSPRPAPGWSAAGCAARPTGWAPAQMTRMYEYYDAVLHAVREGLVVLDRRRGRVAAGQRRGPPAARPATADAPVIDQPVDRARPAARARPSCSAPGATRPRRADPRRRPGARGQPAAARFEGARSAPC